jgi:Flp pilus assembly protein TadG
MTSSAPNRTEFKRCEMRSPRGPIHPPRNMRRGVAAAELALAVPLLLVILLICVDGCRLFYAYNTITNAARNGALWASDPLANPAIAGLTSQSPYTTVQQAALADANNLNPALPSANITQSPSVPVVGANVTVTVQYTFNLLTSYLGFGSITMSRQVAMRVEPAAPN